MRDDSSLVKHLTEKHGLECARQWQRVPFVDLSDLKIDTGIFKEKTDNADFTHMPWNDVILHFRLNPLGDCFIRVHSRKTWSWPWVHKSWDIPMPGEVEWIMLEGWWLNPDGSWPIWPSMCVLNPVNKKFYSFYSNTECTPLKRLTETAFCNVSKCTNLPKKSHCDKFAPVYNAMAVISTWGMGHLQQTPEHLVVTRNIKAKSEPLSKKPWARNDLERVILIDPSCVNEYRVASSGGHHVSPKPHHRRGHWRRVRIDDPEQRKVFVRPAWIGDTEWEYQGQTYRVVTKL